MGVYQHVIRDGQDKESTPVSRNRYIRKLGLCAHGIDSSIPQETDGPRRQYGK